MNHTDHKMDVMRNPVKTKRDFVPNRPVVRPSLRAVCSRALYGTGPGSLESEPWDEGTRFQARTPSQARSWNLAADPQVAILVLTGAAGTGKTYLAVGAAVRLLRARKVDRLVLTRPVVPVPGETDLGALPGTLEEKMLPWIRPLLDHLRKHAAAYEIDRWTRERAIEICPCSYLRGRSFERTCIVVDEAQNMTPMQMKALLTRLDLGSRAYVVGDPEQSDRDPVEGPNGLEDLLARVPVYPPLEGIRRSHLPESDVQRHPVVKEILRLYRPRM